MRRSGKTTRAIDEAIQLIFSEGQILVPSKGILLNPTIGGFPEGIKVCIDPDWTIGTAQQNFLVRLKRRIREEHYGSITHEIKKDYIIFKAAQ